MTDPFGNVLGIMHNPHYLEMLRARPRGGVMLVDKPAQRALWRAKSPQLEGLCDAVYGRAMLSDFTLAHAKFGPNFHACAFVRGPEEERSVIDPFLAAGMRLGEKACYIVDPAHRAEHEARLAAAAPSPDLLDVTTWGEAHLKGGFFDQDRMTEDLDVMMRDHAATGRPPMRLVGQMGWVFSSPPGIEQLVAYEASVNGALNRGKTPTVCVYDVRRLNGSLMMDLLRAHPLTVMNGVLHENPFYTPAAELLQELQRRSAAA